MSLNKGELSRRYEQGKELVWRKAMQDASRLGVEIVFEARKLGESCAIYKKRSSQDYCDMAARLLAEYPPELAFYIARQVTSEFGPAIGYIPTPPLMEAIEHVEGLDPAHSSAGRTMQAGRTLVAALYSLTSIDDARETFAALRNHEMRDSVREGLRSVDKMVAQYITGDNPVAPQSLPG